MTFENKLVAIINKDIETGVAMNAIAHMVLGFGANSDKNSLHLDIYKDKDGNNYPNISQMPFIILRGKSGEIRKAVRASRDASIAHGVFLNTMTGGTYVEQLENTANTPEEGLIYYGAVLFGPKDQVTEITRKFSLYK